MAKQTGATGRVAVGSDLNLGFSETVTAKDALLAYGATENSGGILVSSSTNQFENVIDGVKLEVLRIIHDCSDSHYRPK